LWELENVWPVLNQKTQTNPLNKKVMKEFLDAYAKTDLPQRVAALKRKRFSDVEDAAGLQYVDLVQEGGGVLGIALVGYTYVLENVGIRFFSLAGTSAGAINTMLLATLGEIQDAKSEVILDVLSKKNLFDLVDGESSIKRLIQKFIKKERGKMFHLILNVLKIKRIIQRSLGVNPGKNFTDWIAAELNKANIKTVGDLKSLRKKLPEGLFHIGGQDLSKAEAKLAIITSDVTTHTKVEFPKMAELYWRDPDAVKPSDLVRASMSIPFFFEPYEVKDIPTDKKFPSKNGSKTYTQLWDDHASYTGPIPPSVKFVDGGMLSNFPINVFHRTDGKAPSRPTFGVRLSTYRDNFADVKNLMSFSGAMISTMRQIHDYDFLMRNPEYRLLICRIDADKDFNWLDFEMPQSEQIKLFVQGAKKAAEFLECFDWEKYKETRMESAKVIA
jgi:NTE family protein